MSWKSYAAEVKGGGGQALAMKADEVMMRLFTPKTGTARLQIRLGAGVMKAGKLTARDTVDLLVSDDKAKALVKKAEKGWKLHQFIPEATEFSVPWGDKRLFDFDSKSWVKLACQFEEGGVTLTVPQKEGE